MSAVCSADPRTFDVPEWVAPVAEATVRHDDAAAYATVRTQWTRWALADLGARLELAALTRAASARAGRSR